MNKESKLNLNAGDYAISHCDSDKTYNGLEVHKMLCDAYIAGNNDTLEDDDERIKNSLINLIKMSNEVGGLALHKWEADEMLAWLEKQGSKDKFIEKEAGYEWDADTKELKKIEQSELTEFEEAVKDMMDDYKDAIGAYGATTEEVKEHAAYMLSLIRQKPAWSEEDEEHIDSLLKRLDGLCRNKFERTRFAISEDRDWLKSLRPQNRWKPSDEQMMALLYHCSNGSVLSSLYNDLKKLKES